MRFEDGQDLSLPLRKNMHNVKAIISDFKGFLHVW